MTILRYPKFWVLNSSLQSSWHLLMTTHCQVNACKKVVDGIAKEYVPWSIGCPWSDGWVYIVYMSFYIVYILYINMYTNILKCVYSLKHTYIYYTLWCPVHDMSWFLSLLEFSARKVCDFWYRHLRVRLEDPVWQGLVCVGNSQRGGAPRNLQQVGIVIPIYSTSIVSLMPIHI